MTVLAYSLLYISNQDPIMPHRSWSHQNSNRRQRLPAYFWERLYLFVCVRVCFRFTRKPQLKWIPFSSFRPWPMTWLWNFPHALRLFILLLLLFGCKHILSMFKCCFSLLSYNNRMHIFSLSANNFSVAICLFDWFFFSFFIHVCVFAYPVERPLTNFNIFFFIYCLSLCINVRFFEKFSQFIIIVIIETLSADRVEYLQHLSNKINKFFTDFVDYCLIVFFATF